MTDPIDRRVMLGAAGLLGAAALSRVASAGPLNPPAGPITPTGKTLTEVEPRIPINQTTAPGTATAIHRITQPGSYYLTGNILGQSGKHGIEINSPGVTLDLMGFELQGVPGSLDGVVMRSDGSPFVNISILNGSVRNWGGAGIGYLTVFISCVRIERIAASLNGGSGIRGGQCTIANCTVRFNEADGIEVFGGSVISNCAALGNSGRGFVGNTGTAISNCAAQSNGAGGISTTSSCSIVDCTAVSNAGPGIESDQGSTISNCSAEGNEGAGITAQSNSMVSRCSSLGNISDGIAVGNGCTVRDNNCRNNGFSLGSGAGILVNGGADNRIEDNNCTDNTWGIRVTTAGNFIARNTCSGNTTLNWDIAANNKCLVVDGMNAPAISGNSGGVSPGSTDPNANFTY